MSDKQREAAGASSAPESTSPAQVEAALLVTAAPEGEGDSAIAEVCARARRFAEQHGIHLQEVSVEALLDNGAGCRDRAAHWVVIGDDTVMLKVIDAAEAHEAGLGLIPVGRPTRCQSFYDLPTDRDEALALAFRMPESGLDVLRCNGELVQGQAAVGDVPFLDRRGHAVVHAQDRLWRRWAIVAQLFWTALRRIFQITPSPVRLHLSREDNPRRCAVTGIVLLENDVENVAGRLVGEGLSARDGRLTALLVAPTSIVRYLGFLLATVFTRKSNGRLPGALSYLKTQHLVIESDRELEYRIDGTRRRAKRIEVTVHPQGLRLNAGPRFDGMDGPDEEGKDTLKLGNLPENEARLALIRHRLPLFTHALEDDFKDLFLLLKDSARIGPDYFTLSILSALIGTLGLLLDSAAVIIGAMVLAPLMAPIICVSMAALRRDVQLLKPALVAIGAGVGLSMAVAALIAILIPMRMVNPEIEARLEPSLLDLAVAVFSGVAGAYAYARESVMKSLPGVAIAVALVPPLAVIGIGIGWWDTRIMMGASLLFATNLVGIALAGAVTFMVLGYGPVRSSKHGLIYPALAVVVVAIPLALSFMRMHVVWQAENSLRDQAFVLPSGPVRLEATQVRFINGTLHVRADVYADQWDGPETLRDLRGHVAEAVGRPVHLDVTPRFRY
ncbi:DUF389 domain-containing protein [Algiphilus sp. NNCM1]|uniref:DUF389 domain-containing protein n=1 Tax=Algiphilus sp. TaxID=1872431 RepID=UPI001CA6E953|nr:DUF389 domain-containing protein [Algiphilus sp.]MBY8965584.1 DUF389 domain-containing protein [Algiphilus acroporae]MCI5063923.1 DUF389 domain-containing protein [Algiphilus sp.]MCI5102691.1 DUF389 domain-containing protein [Algiphilus sp.]